jgi:antitoxin HicB
MNTNTIKDLAYYESLPYTLTIRKDNEGDFVARIGELPGCIAHGEDESSAIKNLRSMQRLWLEDALSAGDAIPEPEEETGLPSGKWLQRVPRRLHRDLVHLARRDNVSLNQLVTAMLSEAVTLSTCAHAVQTVLTNLHQSLSSVVPDVWMWRHKEKPKNVTVWTIAPHAGSGSITDRLSRVKSLTSREPTWPPFLGSQYADEHTESRKQLAKK